jgi:hypothetical protein
LQYMIAEKKSQFSCNNNYDRVPTTIHSTVQGDVRNGQGRVTLGTARVTLRTARVTLGTARVMLGTARVTLGTARAGPG